MFNWIALYLVNEVIYAGGTGPMYDARNTPHPQPAPDGRRRGGHHPRLWPE